MNNLIKNNRKILDEFEKYFDLKDSDNVCFLCNKPKYFLVRKVTHFGYEIKFKKCQCGMIKQTPMPNETFFKWFFISELFVSSKNSSSNNIWGYYDYLSDEPSRLATSKQRFKKICKTIDLAPKSSILKIGPATGTFLYLAQEAGHQVKGCDISDQFANYAKDNYNVPIDVGRFERKNYPEESFDVVVLFNVIENIPNLNEFMIEISKVLKPDGFFIFNHVRMSSNVIEKLQGGRYFMYRPPICYMFSSNSLEKLLKKFNLLMIDSALDIRYLTPEKIFSLLGWKFMTKLVRLFGIHRLSIPLYAYPSRITIAQKKCASNHDQAK